MAGEAANYELERAAGIVKDWSVRCATPDQDVVLEDLIEILRRLYQLSRHDDVDDAARAVADWCVTAYGPPLFGLNTAETPDKAGEVTQGEKTSGAAA